MQKVMLHKTRRSSTHIWVGAGSRNLSVCMVLSLACYSKAAADAAALPHAVGTSVAIIIWSFKMRAVERML